jgi:hypothetical protein
MATVNSQRFGLDRNGVYHCLDRTRCVTLKAIVHENIRRLAQPRIRPFQPLRPTPIWLPWSLPGPSCRGPEGRHHGDEKGRVPETPHSGVNRDRHGR